MNAHAHVDALTRFPIVLAALLDGLPDDRARHRPDSTRWSILEVVAHLADEEAEDFRTRLFQTLDAPDKPWPPIDPEGWAAQRGYRERDLPAELSRFFDERHRSLAELRGLPMDTDWSRAYEHPRYGRIAAGSLLAAWAQHDLLHLRQLTRRLYELSVRDAGGFHTPYAGEWPA